MNNIYQAVMKGPRKSEREGESRIEESGGCGGTEWSREGGPRA